MSKHIDDVMDIIDAMCRFTESMKDLTRANMRERIPHYRELVASLEEMEEKFYKALDECSKEQSQCIRDYMIDLRDVQELEGDYFYMHGFSDCVTLMYRLNLLK
jgi:hypothetical protein